MSSALPAILAEIKAMAGGQPILPVFDRSGYSGPVFRTLTAQGIGFLTCLKGRKARRRFPRTCFERRWWAADDPAGITGGHRHVYQIYDRATRVTHAGLVRTLVVADGDARIPVLTNRGDLPAAKAVHLLRMRWRQENSFKYLSTHYGVGRTIAGWQVERVDGVVLRRLEATRQTPRKLCVDQELHVAGGWMRLIWASLAANARAARTSSRSRSS